MRIQDGLGSGNEAQVDNEGRLSTLSVTEATDRHSNKHTGAVWSIPFAVTPVGAGDYFLYISNTSTVDYYITDIRIDAASAEVVGVHKVTGTPSFTSGTDITAISRNFGSNTAPTATIKSDTDTTGLTDGGEMFFLTCEANKLSHLRTTSNIIIVPGSSLALKATTGGVAVKGMVSLTGSE